MYRAVDLSSRSPGKWGGDMCSGWRGPIPAPLGLHRVHLPYTIFLLYNTLSSTVHFNGSNGTADTRPPMVQNITICFRLPLLFLLGRERNRFFSLYSRNHSTRKIKYCEDDMLPFLPRSLVFLAPQQRILNRQEEAATDVVTNKLAVVESQRIGSVKESISGYLNFN